MFDDKIIFQDFLHLTEEQVESVSRSRNAKDSVFDESMRVYEQFVFQGLETFIKKVRLREVDF